MGEPGNESLQMFVLLNLNIFLKVLVQGYSGYIIVMTIMGQWSRPKEACRRRMRNSMQQIVTATIACMVMPAWLQEILASLRAGANYFRPVRPLR